MVEVMRLPYDAEAEKSVLGAMMMDPAAAIGVLDVLDAEDFYLESHKIAYDAMVGLIRKESPCDLLVLTNRLREDGLLEQTGGASYLSAMGDVFPDVANVESYARIVRDKSLKRQLMRVCSAVLTECELDRGTAEELVQEAQEGVYRLADEVGPSPPVRVGELVDEQIRMALELSRGERESVGLSMGWQQMDRLTGGLFPGEVTLIAARTSVGKSSFAIDLSRRVAKGGGRVLYLSLEMRKESLIQKMLGCMARVNTRAFRDAGYSLEESDRHGTMPVSRLRNAGEELRGMQLDLWDATDVTPMRLRTRCRQMSMAGGLDLVVVDYVGLMTADGEHRQAHEEQAEISREIVRLAADLEVPVIACAQVNRAGDKRDKQGKVIPPLLSEISGSTKWEQNSHQVIFLSRDVAKQQQQTDVILAKGRMGETGTRVLRFELTESRFDQMGTFS